MGEFLKAQPTLSDEQEEERDDMYIWALSRGLKPNSRVQLEGFWFSRPCSSCCVGSPG